MKIKGTFYVNSKKEEEINHKMDKIERRRLFPCIL